jgi:hypothetical protein
MGGPGPKRVRGLDAGLLGVASLEACELGFSLIFLVDERQDQPSRQGPASHLGWSLEADDALVVSGGPAQFERRAFNSVRPARLLGLTNRPDGHPFQEAELQPNLGTASLVDARLRGDIGLEADLSGERRGPIVPPHLREKFGLVSDVLK